MVRGVSETSDVRLDISKVSVMIILRSFFWYVGCFFHLSFRLAFWDIANINATGSFGTVL
jgi:hypothetical protein